MADAEMNARVREAIARRDSAMKHGVALATSMGRASLSAVIAAVIWQGPFALDWEMIAFEAKRMQIDMERDSLRRQIEGARKLAAKRFAEWEGCSSPSKWVFWEPYKRASEREKRLMEQQRKLDEERQRLHEEQEKVWTERDARRTACLTKS